MNDMIEVLYDAKYHCFFCNILTKLQVQLLPAGKSIPERLLVEKIAFDQKTGNLRRWWTQCCPETISEESAQP